MKLIVHAGHVEGTWHLLFKSKKDGEKWCKENNHDVEELEQLANGLWRLDTMEVSEP